MGSLTRSRMRYCWCWLTHIFPMRIFWCFQGERNDALGPKRLSNENNWKLYIYENIKYCRGTPINNTCLLHRIDFSHSFQIFLTALMEKELSSLCTSLARYVLVFLLNLFKGRLGAQHWKCLPQSHLGFSLSQWLLYLKSLHNQPVLSFHRILQIIV